MQSLRFKWSLTLVITSLVGIVLVGILATQINSREFERFRNSEFELNIAAIAAEYFAQTNTFDGFEAGTLEMASGGRRNHRNNDNNRRGSPIAIVDVNGVVVDPSDKLKRGDIASTDDINRGTPIIVDDEQVGTLIVTVPQQFDEAEIAYLQRTNSALLIAAAGAVLVAVILGVFLSRQFLRPLAELTDAIGSIQQGKFDQRVPVRTKDELGELAQAFNQMGEELQRVNQLRRQMTADIAHDLRTPLTVISGYLEGLRDGSLKPTQARFDTLYQESQLLKRLIEDLRTLSLADAGELNLSLQVVEPAELLEQVKISFTPLAESQDVRLVTDADPILSPMQVDRDRVVQVLGNLVSNSLRFTPAGGRITLSAHRVDGMLELIVRDTGSGISPEHLQNIFARFYRVNESRYQNESESGLGLAIAKSIVSAHGGTIRAESIVGQGTTMRILLPVT